MDKSLEGRLLSGDRRALSRLLTHVENGTERGRHAIEKLYPYSGHSMVIGVTGSPGVGKSTVVGALTQEYRNRGRSVGIVAIDSSSPFTTGAILGDRVRMQILTSDEEVFIRSLASRGARGGLSSAAADAVVLLDAFGKDVVLIETVGAGQGEFDIVNAAHITVLVNTPGTGDDIQIMKAGIMEIADIHGVNKADLPGADLTVNQLRSLLSTNPAGVHTAEIIRMVAITGDGIDDLADACDAHYEFLVGSGELGAEDRKRARFRIVSLAQGLLVANLFNQSGGDERLDSLAAAVADRTLDPHTAVKQWVGN